ncbi:MAG TPA: twin-arginine translocase TatA/TatE family subunit [Acidimicrobiales bacterium]|nr:twin-arginine translocase TatA/TatE family subunit [Acidimicrobiales bacterium]
MPTSLGPAEILVILVVALIVLGPKKLPEAGRQVGKAIAEVRKWSQGFQDEIKSAIDPEATRPTYSQPQPGYDPPPIPVIPAETSPPAEPNDVHTNDVHTNGSGTVTTGSHGLISGPPPADTTPTDGPPAGDAPQP